MENFIKTTDKETADKLLGLGFKLIYQDGAIYQFMNDKNIKLDFEDKNKKMTYTNMMYL